MRAAFSLRMKYRLLVFLLLSFGLMALTDEAGAGDWRDFKNASGVVIRARVVAVKDGQVTIERSDRRQFTVSVTSLSAPDQEFLMNWQATGGLRKEAANDKPVVGKPPSKLDLAPFYEKH
eukprot:gene48997-59981_t